MVINFFTLFLLKLLLRKFSVLIFFLISKYFSENNCKQKIKIVASFIYKSDEA